MKKMNRLLILVMFGSVLFACPAALAATYYIDAVGGSDSNSGTSSEQPWRTLSKISGSAQFSAGDVIRLKRGVTWNEAVEFRSSGSSSGRITITSYGSGEKPLINVPDTAAGGGIFLRDGRHHIIIDGLRFAGGMKGKSLLNVENVYEIEVRNCDFTGMTPDHALRIYHDSGSRDSYNIIIDGCTFRNTGPQDAVRLQPGTISTLLSDVTIRNCIFENIGGNGVTEFHTTWISDAGMEPRNISVVNNTFSSTGRCAFMSHGIRNLTLSYNVCANIGSSSQANVNALQVSGVLGGIVEGNIITGVNTSVPDGVGIIIDWSWKDNKYLCDNVIIRRNIVSGCRASSVCPGIEVYKGTNILIYDNIVFDCPRGIQFVNPQSSGGKIYNNTITDVTAGIYLRLEAPQPVIKNNIIRNASYGIVFDSGAVQPVEDYNCYHNISRSRFYDGDSGVSAAIGANSITQDPLLKNPGGGDYSLEPGSPCIDSGTALNEVTVDYAGTARPQGSAYDIGAYEYVSGNIIVPPQEGEIPVVSVIASSYQEPNAPENTIDNDLITRWAAQGYGQYIEYDLGSVKSVSGLKIAWYSGDTRKAYFDIEAGTDAVTWAAIASGLESSGKTLELEPVSIPRIDARYIRIVGQGNSYNNWCSITETKIIGDGELLANPGFEDGTAGWSDWGSGRSVVSAEAYSGKNALKIVIHSTAWLEIWQDVPVAAGINYAISAYVKTLNSADSGRGRLLIKWLDRSGTEISYADTWLGDNVTSTYKKVSGTRTAPANAVTLRVRCQARSGSGTAYFDDVSVMRE